MHLYQPRKFSVVWKIVLLLAGLTADRAFAQVTINVTVTDTTGMNNSTTANLTNAIVANARAGILEWTQFLNLSGPRTLDVVVRFSSTVLHGASRSVSATFVRQEGGRDVYEQGAARKLRDGRDDNGNEYDVEFNLNPVYLQNQLWFDPSPLARTNRVPEDRIDAVSFFAHEFGHVLAFNGWKNTANGKLPGNYQSVWDCHAEFDGTNWFFHGATAMAVWGTPVPLSRVNNSYHHDGNPTGSNAPGADRTLQNGLMNGVNFNHGTRYRVNLLDVAMIKDLGLKILPGIQFFREVEYAVAHLPDVNHN